MAKLRIQGKSSNHGDNKNIGPKSANKLHIQAGGANYAGAKVSKKSTPSPPNRPYGATTRNAPKPSGRIVLPSKAR